MGVVSVGHISAAGAFLLSTSPTLSFGFAFPKRLSFCAPRLTYHAKSSSTALSVDGQGMAAGSSRHLLGDVLRSLQPRYLSRVAEAVRGNVRGAREVDLTGMGGGRRTLVGGSRGDAIEGPDDGGEEIPARARRGGGRAVRARRPPPLRSGPAPRDSLP